MAPPKLPKDLAECRRFFLEPKHSKHRMYEALRAYFVEERSSAEAARDFGYTAGSFRVMCHHFRRDPNPAFFLPTRPGPKDERSTAWSERRSASAVEFSLAPRKFTTAFGGLFLFVPELVRLDLEDLARAAGLPGSKVLPAGHALRACLALKLWSVERNRRVIPVLADEGLGFFAGLNVFPQMSTLSEYSARVGSDLTDRLLLCWNQRLVGDGLFDAGAFRVDFHAIRREPGALVFLGQDARGHAFCYANTEVPKGEEAGELLRFVYFCERSLGLRPRDLVFGSNLTTPSNLAKLDELGINFIILRRRGKRLVKEIADIPRSSWRRMPLELPGRVDGSLLAFEQTPRAPPGRLRRLFIRDLEHEAPAILLTNDSASSALALVRRARQMFVEDGLPDAVRFFHTDALSSAAGLEPRFDMVLLVIASGVYRLAARKMRDYRDAPASVIFRELIDVPAEVEITHNEVRVGFHAEAGAPVLSAFAMMTGRTISVPWWGGKRLRTTSEGA